MTTARLVNEVEDLVDEIEVETVEAQPDINREATVSWVYSMPFVGVKYYSFEEQASLDDQQ